MDVHRIFFARVHIIIYRGCLDGGSVLVLQAVVPSQRGCFFIFFYAECNRLLWSLVAFPCHGRHKGRVAVEMGSHEVVYTLMIVEQELVAEECMSLADVAQVVQFACYVADIPFPLLGVEEVDAQSRCDDFAIAMLFPVDGEGEELVASEVHHREELVHESVFQPSLGVLRHLGIGIPSMAPVSAQVVELAYRRATHLYPWLFLFHRLMDFLHNAGNVTACLVFAYSELPGLGIAYVVEVDAVHIVSLYDFATHFSQVAARLCRFRVHVSILVYSLDESWKSLSQLSASVRVPFSHGYGHYPCMHLHAPFVAFVDGKLQGVIAW